MKTISVLRTTLLIGALTAAPTGFAADAGKDAGDAVRGAKAWAENCSRCHNMRGVQDLRDDQWIPVVYHMRVRAGLTGQEMRDIIQFLQQSN